MAIKKADVAALTGEPPTPAAPDPQAALTPASDPDPEVQPDPQPAKRPFMSEGVRQDLLIHGSAVDPVTGRKLTRDDLR
jgi:hypothetical protein